MLSAQKNTTFYATDKFISAERGLSELIEYLNKRESMTKQHSDIESEISEELQRIGRDLLQGHFDARGKGDVGASVNGNDGVLRTHKRESTHTIRSIFGTVTDTRLGYRHTSHNSLFPKDASLNLPQDSYTHGLHKLLAKESIRGSIDEAITSVADQTGVTIPKRQALKIIQTVSCDFDNFYQEKAMEDVKDDLSTSPIQVLTTDGKGVVMRMEGLREATQNKRRASKEEAIATGSRRLKTGEKKNGKRMAQVASTYCIDRHIRKPEDIAREYSSQTLLSRKEEKLAIVQKKPSPERKRVWASLEKDQGSVIEALFDEALKRDPLIKKEWVALVDGQKSQLTALSNEAKKHAVEMTVIVDIIHVIEYLWKASVVFHAVGSIEREWWVNKRVLNILQGKAITVGAGMRRSATLRKLSQEDRAAVDTCADYLQNNAPHLKYNEYIKQGYPIATGVIEGACRHLVQDRMGLTGARWGLKGGEAILKLRSIIKSGDFEAYWIFHLKEEYKRNHKAQYSDDEKLKNKGLRLVSSRAD